MTQWSLRITAYADRLISGLDTVDWSESIKECAAERDKHDKAECTQDPVVDEMTNNCEPCLCSLLKKNNIGEDAIEIIDEGCNIPQPN